MVQVSHYDKTDAPMQEAVEVLQEAEGRHFLCEFSATTPIVLEKRAVPEHLKNVTGLDVPTELGEMLRALEDAGEVWRK